MSRFNRPERRNRNAGTAKQGHGQDNRDGIATRSGDSLIFYERLGPYSKVRRRIKGRWFEFVVEQTRPGHIHACTVDDLEHVLKEILFDDVADLRRIILRQPKRKEEQLRGVWGRLIYGFEFEGNIEPAVMIESVEVGGKLAWSKKLTPEGQEEIARLSAAGFNFVEGRRTLEATMSLAAARATQLYRTLPHELGHYLDYHEKVVEPLKEDKQRFDDVERTIEASNHPDDHPVWTEWNTFLDRYSQNQDKLWNLYQSRPSKERETYANRCADRMEKRLKELGMIPFDRKLDPTSLSNDQLSWSDFSTDPNPLTN